MASMLMKIRKQMCPSLKAALCIQKYRNQINNYGQEFSMKLHKLMLDFYILYFELKTNL